MSLRIAQASANKYSFLCRNGDKVELEHRDGKPFARLNRWDGECYLDLNVPLFDSVGCSFAENKLLWENTNYRVALYPTDGHDAGGLELEIVLKKKPPINSISIPISTKNLSFHYQPALTAAEIAEGCHRPDNVVGSYAVYHATRRNIHASAADAEKYKAGKAFHIYRPKLTDANQKTAWADLNITETMLTVNLPQAFLNSAAYPVTVDPTFGYTFEGDTSSAMAADGLRSYIATPAGAGTADFISCYGYCGGANAIKYALYKNSDNTLVDGTAETSMGAAPAAWKTANFASPPAITVQAYDITFFVDRQANDIYYYYDADSATAHYKALAYGAWPEPAGWSGTLNRLISIYCSYTAGGGPTSYTKTFTTDGHLLKRQTKTATADARLLKRSTKTWTQDAQLLKRFAKTFTNDANLLKRQLKTFTVDALLQEAQQKGVTVDALLLKRQIKTWTTDAVLQLATSKGFDVDAILLKRQLKTTTTDAILLKRSTKTFTTDALLQLQPPKGFTVDALLLKTQTVTFTADAFLIAEGAAEARPVHVGGYAPRKPKQILTVALDLTRGEPILILLPQNITEQNRRK